MTHKLFTADPYLLEFTARVVAHCQVEGQPAVELDRTAFFVESGGQPGDTGHLGAVPVTSVVMAEGRILHVLASPLTQDTVRGRVDAGRRRDHLQQHHGQHLLSRAFVEVAEARTLSFHLGADSSTLDLDRPLSPAQIHAAEARCNEVIWEARPVRVTVLDRQRAESLGVDCRRAQDDPIRVVEVQDFDRQACSGTHPRNTAEVGVVQVVSVERYKGGSRVHFVCGHRALSAARVRHDVLDRLVASLSAPVEALPEAAASLLERLEEADKRGRAQLARAVTAEARLLTARATESPTVLVATYRDWPPDELRALALETTARQRSVCLLASRGQQAYLVFAQSKGLGIDVPQLLRQAVGTLEGRGGGRGDVAQGGGPRLDLIEAALGRAADEVRAAWSAAPPPPE